MIVGIFDEINGLGEEVSRVFCGCVNLGASDDLGEADWDSTYVFGIEYTPQGQVLVYVNGSVAQVYDIPQAATAYEEGGGHFWFRSQLVAGTASVSAEIDQVEAKRNVKGFFDNVGGFVDPAMEALVP